MNRIAGLFLAALVSAVPLSSGAQQAGGGGAAAAGGEARQRRSGPRVIRLEEITIEGRIQKPNAFYVLQRSNLGFEVMDLRTSFVNQVVESVGRDPF